tara:strand:+ start:372 stop:644 length:273 start_codon:yes stop_codon:yes gene_type:complete
MSNWFFHRGIPILPDKTAWTERRGERAMKRLPVHSPAPLEAVASPPRTATAAPANSSSFEWLPHCSRRLRELARRSKAAAQGPSSLPLRS